MLPKTANSLLLVLFVFCVAPHVSEAPIWALAVAGLLWALAATALQVPKLKLPPKFVSFLSFVFVLYVYYKFDTLLGPDAATPLLLLLAGLKLNELRSLRDAQSFIYICVLIIMFYLIYDQSIFSTLYMLMGCVFALVCFLFVANTQASLRKAIQHRPRAMFKDVLIGIPIFIGFFLFFPRFTTPWSKMMASPQAQVAFDDSLQPGGMADLLQSDDPAFRVRFLDGETPDTSRLYWRGVVLDKTDGWNWSKGSEGVSKTAKVPLKTLPINYEITLEPKHDQSLFSLETSTALVLTAGYGRNRLEHKREDYFRLKWPAINKFKYQGRAYLLPWFKSRSEDFSRYPYLEVPKKPSKRLLELVQKLKYEDPSPMELANRVTEYFREKGFQYSLSVPEMPELESFLFDQKLGFCEHYSSAFSVLMRMAGVPSRVVMGFQGGEYNDFGKFLVVRDKHAHAWSEIWTERKGWVRIDPTTATNGQSILLGSIDLGYKKSSNWIEFSWYKGLQYWDSLNTQYSQFLLNQSKETTLSDRKQASQEKGYFAWIKAWFTNKNIRLFAIFLAICLGSWLVYSLLARYGRGKNRIDLAYQGLLEKLAQKNVHSRKDEGPLNFGNRAILEYPNRQKKLAELFLGYIRLKYSSESVDQKDLKKFEKDVRSF